MLLFSNVENLQGQHMNDRMCFCSQCEVTAIVVIIAMTGEQYLNSPALESVVTRYSKTLQRSSENSRVEEKALVLLQLDNATGVAYLADLRINSWLVLRVYPLCYNVILL